MFNSRIESLKEFLEIAHSLGISALVETHDDFEVKRALSLGARIIGVNNRNLKDFTVDKERFPDLKGLSDELKEDNIRLIPIIDAGVKIEDGYDLLGNTVVVPVIKAVSGRVGELFAKYNEEE